MKKMLWILVLCVWTLPLSGAEPCPNPALTKIEALKAFTHGLIGPDPKKKESSQLDANTLTHQWLLDLLSALDKTPKAFVKELDGGVEEITIQKDPLKLRPTLVRQLHSESYDATRKKDFLDRLDIMHEAATHLVNPEDQVKVQDALAGVKTKFKAKMPDVDWEAIKTEADSTPSSTRTFDKAYKETLNQFTAYIDEVVKVLKTAPLKEPKDLKNIRKALKKSEDDYLSTRRDRPNIVTIYSGNEKTSPQMISVHRPFSQDINKKVQNSGTRDKAGLSNALQTSFHVRRSDGTLETKFSATRHGVLSPYRLQTSLKDRIAGKIKELIGKPAFQDANRKERLNLAKDNFKDVLAKLVEDYRMTHHGECPERVPLSMTVLLSPTRLDFLRGHGESESEQLWETYLVSQAHSENEVKVEVEKGVFCQVTPDVTLMNLPTHTRSKTLRSRKFSAILGKLGVRIGQAIRVQDSSLLNGINSKGFVEFDHSVSKYLEETLDQLKPHHDDPLKTPHPKLKKIMEALELLTDQKSTKRGFLLGVPKPTLPIPLKTLREAFLNRSLSEQEFSDLTKLEKEYQAQFQDIVKIHNIEYSKKPNFKILYDNLRALEQAMGGIDKERDLSPDLVQRLITQKDLLRLYLESKELFLPQNDGSLNSQNGIGIYNTNQNRHKLQTRLLLANFLLGKNVDFFCKSAEDRTGRIDNSVNEQLIFRERTGRFPYLERESDHNILKNIALEALKGSSNQSTTGENNPGARGHQLHSDPAYGAYSKIGKKTGNLAKNSYKKAPFLRSAYNAFAQMVSKMRELKASVYQGKTPHILAAATRKREDISLDQIGDDEILVKSHELVKPDSTQPNSLRRTNLSTTSEDLDIPQRLTYDSDDRADKDSTDLTSATRGASLTDMDSESIQENDNLELDRLDRFSEDDNLGG